MAVGQPFIYNLPVKLSAVWFPANERSISTMVGLNASVIGLLLAFCLPPLVVNSEVLVFDQHRQTEILNQVQKLNLYTALTSTAILLLVVFLFKEMYFNKFG